MANNKKRLTEIFQITYDSTKLASALANDEPIFLEGVIQRANIKNQNNRIYPKEVLEREINAYVKNFVSENRALGELDHPDRDVVEYKTASHRINAIWWKGDDVWAKIEILSGQFFPCANILRGCLKNNIPIGFSSRGYGSEMQIAHETYEVEDDYALTCWDAVSNPSTKGAFGMLAESAQMGNIRIVNNEFNNLVNYILK